MSGKSELPDYYWHNPELLLGILEDKDDEWHDVREEAASCVRLDSAIAIEPGEDVLVFLQRRDRLVVERVVRRLLGLGRRREVFDVLRQRLHDVAHFAQWMSVTEQGRVPAVDLVFRRGCDVSRWILNAKLRELGALGIDATGLCAQITALADDPGNDEARQKLSVAQGLLEHCLPLRRAELTPDPSRKRPRPKPIPLPREGDHYVLLITGTGFRLVDSSGTVRHVAKLERRLRRLLLAAWAIGWVAQNRPWERGADDPGLNAPVSPRFSIRDLRKVLGRSANRSDICMLRKYLWLNNGPCLLGEGQERLSLVDFCIDVAGRPPGEALRAFMHRCLKAHDIVVPEDCSQSVKRPVKRGVNDA